MGNRMRVIVALALLALPAVAQEAVVATDRGSFVIRLLPELAPKHVAHFLKVAQAGGFDGTTRAVIVFLAP